MHLFKEFKEIPFHVMALSCFDFWHFVLNRSYVYTFELDDQEFGRALQMAPNGSAAALRLEAKSIQGCFWTLRRAYVNAVLEPSCLTSYSNEGSDSGAG